MKKYGIFTWILIIFFAIGVIRSFLSNPNGLIIPVLVFGTIFYFFKHPEKLNRLVYRNSYKQSKNKPKSKNVHFTVIKGKKDDEDTPRYH